ncbi:MAG: cell division protein ZapA [Ruminococcaceae bacterium]|nr:cell division protein ZapA [Oscillospiraceae bacterium]
MKQKYSLMIADIQIGVVTDADPAYVERLVGILDRKMREINLKSRLCSKHEAALLCALEFCADKLAMTDENEELAERCEKYGAVLESFKAQTADLTSRLEELKKENEVLRSLISGAPAQEAVAENVPSPTQLFAEIAEDATNKVVAPAPEEEDPSTSRSRVGSMFDLLSFNDF